MGELGWSVCARDSGTHGRVGRAVPVNLTASSGSDSGDSLGSDLASWPGGKRSNSDLRESGQRRWAVESMPAKDSPLMMDGVRSRCPVDST